MLSEFHPSNGGVPTTLTRILLQKYRNANGRRIAIRVGGVPTTFCQEEGILWQKNHDRNGRRTAILSELGSRFDWILLTQGPLSWPGWVYALEPDLSCFLFFEGVGGESSSGTTHSTTLK